MKRGKDVVTQFCSKVASRKTPSPNRFRENPLETIFWKRILLLFSASFSLSPKTSSKRFIHCPYSLRKNVDHRVTITVDPSVRLTTKSLSATKRYSKAEEWRSFSVGEVSCKLEAVQNMYFLCPLRILKKRSPPLRSLPFLASSTTTRYPSITVLTLYIQNPLDYSKRRKEGG